MKLTKLFLGNLSTKVTENDIVVFFSAQTVDVHSVKLCSDRETGARKRFGFVEVSEADQDRALNMNGEVLLDRALTINHARAQKGNARR